MENASRLPYGLLARFSILGGQRRSVVYGCLRRPEAERRVEECPIVESTWPNIASVGRSLTACTPTLACSYEQSTKETEMNRGYGTVLVVGLTISLWSSAASGLHKSSEPLHAAPTTRRSKQRAARRAALNRKAQRGTKRRMSSASERRSATRLGKHRGARNLMIDWPQHREDRKQPETTPKPQTTEPSRFSEAFQRLTDETRKPGTTWRLSLPPRVDGECPASCTTRRRLAPTKQRRQNH